MRRTSPDAIRQAQAEADAEFANSDRITALIEDDADRAVDDASVARAKAFCVATINRLGRKLYLFRVAHSLPCKQCHKLIAPDDYFTSAFAQLETALGWAYCLKCRRFTWPKEVKR